MWHERRAVSPTRQQRRARQRRAANLWLAAMALAVAAAGYFLALGRVAR